MRRLAAITAVIAAGCSGGGGASPLIPKNAAVRAIRFYGTPTDDLGNPAGIDRGVQVPLG